MVMRIRLSTEGQIHRFVCPYELILALKASNKELFKDDFQSVLHSLRILMFINIINGSLDGM